MEIRKRETITLKENEIKSIVHLNNVSVLLHNQGFNLIISGRGNGTRDIYFEKEFIVEVTQ